VADAREHDEGTTRQLRREPAAVAHGDPAIGAAPYHQRGGGDRAEPADKSVEPELPQHTPQGEGVGGVRHGRVVLIYVFLPHLAGVPIRGA